MMTWIPALRAADPFYEQRMNAGKASVAAKRSLEAVDQLRIAAFGLLDDPKILVQDLAYLAIAQSQLDRSADVESTLNRFVDVESRFNVYDPAALEADTRSQFESLLVKVIPKATLAGVKSLARLTGAPAPAPASAPATRPSGRTPDTARPQPQPATPSNATGPNNASAVAASATPDDALANARLLLKNNKPAEAAAILSEAVKNEPDRRDLRLALLQAATMSSNWLLGTAQLTRLRPFSDAEAVYMFYGAVVLYETHNERDARDLMQRAVPNIVRSAYVDYYAKKLNVRLP